MFTRDKFKLTDEGAWRECCIDNCYRIGKLGSDPVLDVGAHIGCFSLAAICHGATNVHAYEADPRNYHKLMENMLPFHDKVHVHNQAVWRSDVECDSVTLHGFDDTDPNANTGGGTVVTGGDGTTRVPTTKLDVILERLIWVQLLKLDCEGSEYPILYGANQLSKVEKIVAEVHGQFQFSPEAQVQNRDYTVPKLAEYLLSKAGGDFREIQFVPHKTYDFLTILWALR